MKVKKYYSFSPYEAFKQIRTDLGGDAMILYSQKVRQSGWLGYLKKPVYEVGAALDVPEPEAAAETPIPPPTGINRPVESDDDPAGLAPDVLSIKELLASRQLEARKLYQDVAQGNADGAMVREDSLVQVPVRPELGKPATRSASASGNGGQRISRSTRIKEIEQQLLSTGLDAVLMKKILRDIPAELSLKALQSYATVSWAARSKLENSLPVTESELPVGTDPAVIFLVGPTGVGKTTTTAKFAARFALQRGRRVFLATLDTRRLGAIPQLRAYADILDIPLEVIYSPSELEGVLASRSRGDLTFVDTTGINRRNPDGLADLARFVAAAGNPCIYLVLSTASRDEDVTQVVADLGTIHIHGLVITKVDETEMLGRVYNVVSQAAKPLAYLATGQNVPDDIERASASAIVSQLMGMRVERQ